MICVNGTIYALVSTGHWYDRPGYASVPLSVQC
uniref:Uncharacterized protein n=1 Tax=Setaria viridis TaxID=4556 RepID=A0A4U6TAX7_SETVI|nr:hypothetical protein SEVIR_9G563250v2 [Setaria viridis]